MGVLDGRVAIVTGAGRGIGREHAVLIAREGAHVVVNDLGRDVGGGGDGQPVAEQVVDEIVAAGGSAVASRHDVGDFGDAEALVAQAVDTYGRLDVLVNNAGILRDNLIADMTEQEWDSVIRVNLKGTFATLHWAARHWVSRFETEGPVRAAVVNTTSGSGLFGTPGQANYGAAKAGVAALTVIAARELERFGVRVNSVAPQARSRMYDAAFEQHPDKPLLMDHMSKGWNGAEPEGFRSLTPRQLSELAGDDAQIHPALVAPLVAYLATEHCTINGQCFEAGGPRPVTRLRGWTRHDVFEHDGSWGIADYERALGSLDPVETPRR